MTQLNKGGMRVTYRLREAASPDDTHELIFENGDPERFAQQLQIQMNNGRVLLAPRDNSNPGEGFLLLPVSNIAYISVDPA